MVLNMKVHVTVHVTCDQKIIIARSCCYPLSDTTPAAQYRPTSSTHGVV